MGFGGDCCPFCITALSDGSPSWPLPGLKLLSLASAFLGRPLEREEGCREASGSPQVNALPQHIPTRAHHCPRLASHPTQCPPAALTVIGIATISWTLTGSRASQGPQIQLHGSRTCSGDLTHTHLSSLYNMKNKTYILCNSSSSSTFYKGHNHRCSVNCEVPGTCWTATLGG